MSMSSDDPKFTAYVLGELDPDEHEELRQLIEESDELTKVIAEIREIADALTASVETEEKVCLTDDQKQALFACEEQYSVARKKHGRPFWAFAATVAASLIIGIGLYASKTHQESRRQNPNGSEIAELRNLKKSASVTVSEKIVDDNGIVLSVPTEESITTELDSLAAGLAEQKQPEERRALGLQSASLATQAELSRATRRIRDGEVSQTVDYSVPDGGSVPVRAVAITSGKPASSTRTFRVTELKKNEESRPALQPDESKSLRNFSFFVEGARPESPVPADAFGVVPLGEGLIPELEGEGRGAGEGGDKFNPIEDNPFRNVTDEPLSTFSIDVDTASYSKVRVYLQNHNQLPPAGSVRIEELINYFNYDYAGPTDEKPFASQIEVAGCPWRPKHRIVRVGIKGKEIDAQARPHSNLVFLLDVSGSMDQPNKLPLLKRGMKRLVDELGENDRVAIVVYAGAAGLVLPSTHGDQKQNIIDSLEQLRAGGSTNGGQGIQLAYQTALDNFIEGGTNRVILCTDGDFNVGTTSTADLVNVVSEKSKDGIFISVLGFGIGNHNDAMLEQISNKGNGNYAFIDTDSESRKVLVEQLSGTLVTIAKDVKIQIEFNPAQVTAYRLIGYENRILAAQDFNDDKKDAGEIGAGHTVTALYEIVPKDAAGDVAIPPIDELKYQKKSELTEVATDELLTLKIRYKNPDAYKSELLSFPVKDDNKSFAAASADFKFATSVAGFGMLLRNSPHKGDATYNSVEEIASGVVDSESSDYRREFLDLIRSAKQVSGE